MYDQRFLLYIGHNSCKFTNNICNDEDDWPKEIGVTYICLRISKIILCIKTAYCNQTKQNEIYFCDLQADEERATTYIPRFYTLLQKKRFGAIFCLKNALDKEYDKNRQHITLAQKQWSVCAKFICIQHSAIVYSKCKK